MKLNRQKQISELKMLFHSGSIDSVNEGLKNLTELNDVSLEEELLAGTLYENKPGGGGFSEWSISRNKFFTPPKSENIFEMNELEGNLWVGLISLLGRSQCPAALSLRKEIKSLSFFGCNMPYIPAEIGNFSNLEILIVNNYAPTVFEEEKVNPLPPEIGNLKKLKWLDISQNRGLAPPPEIGKLTRLTALLVSANIITEITDEIWNLKNLRTLNLENNRLTSVSEKIENLTNLKTLKLLGNSLKTLPPEIGKLVKLEELEIMYNPLESLPDEMENLKKLKPFYLANTRLTEFPPVLRKLKKTAGMEEEFFPWLTGDIPVQIQNFFAAEIRNFDDPRLKFLNLGSFGYPKTAAAWKNLILCSTDACILIWNAENFELIWKTSAEGFDLISISEDGTFFLCASQNRLIRRYNISQNNAEFVWEQRTDDFPVAFSISSDGEKFAVCHEDRQGFIYIRDCRDGSLIRKIGGPVPGEDYEGYGCTALAFSRDGRIISAGDANFGWIRHWDIDTGGVLKQPKDMSEYFLSAAYSVCGKYLILGSKETLGTVWRTGKWKKLMSFEDSLELARNISVHPKDGKIFASATFDVIHLWNIESGEQTEEFTLPDNDYSIEKISFSENGFICAYVQYVGGDREQKTGSSFIVLAFYESME